MITEPDDMPKCYTELSGDPNHKENPSLEQLLDAGEAYLTDYIWGNYTLVVLPPSFPYGGMENPMLTFASPTIIVGDGS